MWDLNIKSKKNNLFYWEIINNEMGYTEIKDWKQIKINDLIKRGIPESDAKRFNRLYGMYFDEV